MVNAVDRKNAVNKIYEHSRDLLKLKVELPLGDLDLKKVHTNQFLFTHLPSDFALVNWETLGNVLSSNYNRYSGAKTSTNRWYIEGCTIDVDVKGTGKMSLDTNAFASTLNSYSEDYKSFQDAMNNTSTSNNSSTKSKSNAVKSNNNTIKNGWWGDWVTKTVKAQVGDETDVLKNCKKMHEFFRWKTRWTGYSDMPYTGGSVKNLEKQWHRHKFNCGDGANYLSAFYSCCGAKTGIYLTYDKEHYIVKVEINGKTYWCDHSGAEGAYNTLRGWNSTWHGYRSGIHKGKYV